MMAPEALGRLIDDHAAALVLFARQWATAPDDVVQEAFVKLAGLTTDPAHPIAWLFTAVRRAAISAARSERRRRAHESRAASRTASWFVPTEGAELDAAQAADALANLPLDEREAIIAHLWGGLTFEQIGPLIGTSAATAFRRYQAGLATLRTQMGEPCPNPSTIRT
jgi:RNA polymerase sigma factor (sigma-70 family)